MAPAEYLGRHCEGLLPSMWVGIEMVNVNGNNHLDDVDAINLNA